jgi:hypothetical protein
LVFLICGASPAAPNQASEPSGVGASKRNPATAPNTAAPESGAPGPSSNTPYPLLTVSVNGKQLATQGVLINGHTLLPIMDLVQRLGGKAMWDAQTKTVWAAFPRQKRTLRLVVASPEATIYGYNPKDPHRTGSLIATTHMDQPPLLLAGSVLAPADAAANIVRAKVFYKPETKQVVIVAPSGKQTVSR